MDLTRRRFLQLSGVGALGAIVFNGCSIPETELEIQSPVLIPEDVVAGGESWYASLCRQCPSVEGVLVRVVEGRAKKVEGNPEYPLNLGKHSARCEAALQELYHPDRLQQPFRRDGATGQNKPITWDEGLNELVTRLKALRDAGQASRVLVITDPLRGHLGKVTQLFAAAYGAQHLAFEPMERVVLRQAIKDVYGQDRLPHFDIGNSAYVLSFGADFLGTWVSPVSHSVAYGEFRQGEGRGRGLLVQVEPRFSMTAASADRWLPVRPGTEGLLALALAREIIAEGLADPDAARALTDGRGIAALDAYGLERVADDTGLTTYFGKERAVQLIQEVAHDFATKRPSLALGGDTAAAHTNGLFNLRAIYALNYLVGSVGAKGGVIFNPPSPIDDVPDTASGAPLSRWQEVAERLQRGEFDVVITRGVNLVHGLPGALQFQEALKKADLIVSFASVPDDTTAIADLVLSEHVALEAWGDDIPDPAPGYQTVGFQQPVVRPLYDSRAFGDVLLAIAPEIGDDLGAALPWNTMQDVVKEGAQRLFALNRGWAKATAPFDAFWVRVLGGGGWWDTTAISAQKAPGASKAPAEPVRPSFAGDASSDAFYLLPFRSHALLEGRNAHLPWLQASPDPTTTGVWQTWVEINQKEAERLEIREGDLVELVSPAGAIEVIVYPTPAAAPDVLSVPMGQGHASYGRYAKKRGANPFQVIAPQKDETGALAWAATRVVIRKTEKRTRMIKLEGLVEARQMEESPVIQVTRGEEGS
ncbi:MAG: 4Fe-4S ferredoxin [Dehalococcoidia bacterium]|nr:4Fe-4S ferredoxin [Dehalococcoidia bacterium]